MIKQIMINCMILLCFNGCIGQSNEKKFLAKYEYMDFSQFKNASVFIRGVDSERNPIVFVDAPCMVRDTSKVGCYVVVLDRKNHRVLNARWMVEYDVEADTINLQQLAQMFIEFSIPRLEVDKQGNVFVYLKDAETLTMIRFSNENGLRKQTNDGKWIRIRGCWYKPK